MTRTLQTTKTAPIAISGFKATGNLIQTARFSDWAGLSGFDANDNSYGGRNGNGRNEQERNRENKMNRSADFFIQMRSRFLRTPKNRRQVPRGFRQEAVFSKTTNQTGIEFDKYDNLEVNKKGQDVEDFQPLESYEEIQNSLPPFLNENIKLCNFTKPTPIQKHGIPFSLAGRDLMCSAQTGSGKTAAFLIPATATVAKHALVELEQNDPRVTPRCMILAPTRELAIQIHQDALRLCQNSPFRAIALYGGSSVRTQMESLVYGCDVLIATPGRLNDFLERGIICLAQTKFLVLDEADRMLDMGFEPQLRSILNDYDMPKKTEGRQTMMYSATFAKEIQELAMDYLHNYAWISVGRVGATSDTITQNLLEVPHAGAKDDALLGQLAEVEGRTLVFMNQKRMADALTDFLYSKGIPSVALHGDLEQNQRERALQRFRNGQARVLVATDVAARGLDIPSVEHVVNYDFPQHVDDYVHRIGRTGRNGHRGVATSFITSQDQHAYKRDSAKTLKEAFGKAGLPAWYEEKLARMGGGFSGGDRKSVV